MTIEKRIIVGVEDIKLVSYECKKCGARISFTPDKPLDPAAQCFKCIHAWLPSSNSSDGRESEYKRESLFYRLLEVIGLLRNPDVSKTYGFRVLFEFEQS